MKYVLVGVVISIVTYGQLVIKWRATILRNEASLGDMSAVANFLFRALTDVGVVSGRP